jgi:tetratricopeptide (TPR) repeat protein
MKAGPEYRIVFLIGLLVIFVSNVFAASEVDKTYLISDIPYEELNKMEILANQARELYWKGEYQKALEIYTTLTQSKHPSTPLYYNEISQCHIALGDITSAEKQLLEVERFFQVYNTTEVETKALSNFGKEAQKIYLGDPYEQATNYLLLSLIYMDKGDFDNALAACKSGLLADSDARENKFESDYTFLYLLEIKLHQLLGKTDDAARCRDLAKESYVNTHPSCRSLFSERLDMLELLSLPEDQRKKLNVKETTEEIKKKIQETENSFSNIAKNVKPENDLGVLVTGEYNTLIVIPVGKGPQKSRKGKDGQIVIIETDPMNYGKPEVSVDKVAVNSTPVSEVANISYQALTRGGRRMDGILNGKTVYRSTTVGTGQLITEIGNNVGGYGGLAMALIGVAVQGIGGAMSPEADTRSWQLLPSAFEVYALNLPPGEHEIEVFQRVYFEKKTEFRKKVNNNGAKSIAVVFAPPTPAGIYSDVIESGTEVKKIANASSGNGERLPLLITPPLGLKKIERFPSIESGEQPEAIAPDLKKIAKKIEKRLAASSIQVERANHSEIANHFEALSQKFPVAFQAEFNGLDLKKDQDDKIYSLRLNFTMVETASGKARVKASVTGEYRKMKGDKSGSTDAFYKCFDDAIEKFVSQKDIQKMLQGPS